LREAGPRGPASLFVAPQARSIVRAVKNTRLAAIAAFVSLVSLLSMAGPAAAQQVISSHGQTGDWGYLPADDPSSPGAKCGYSAAHDDGFAYLRWVKVRAPRIAARDITSGQDQQQVSWQAVIQRSSTTGWKTIKKSAVHTFTANDQTSSPHSAIKVYVTANNDQNWRAVVLIKWLRNGSTEGWVKASITYYGVKWTVGDPAFVYTNSCDGRAD
jgi:hypothetical protein